MELSAAAIDRELAPAKINLFLHITGRRADGYHELESLFAFTDLADELVLTATGAAAEADSLRVTGAFAAAPGLAGGDNLVLRAVSALRAWGAKHQPERSMPPVHLALDKAIPVAAGLGGGSADAAAALRLLVRHWDLRIAPSQLHVLALSLGADVPACLTSTTQFVSGIGEVLQPASVTSARLDAASLVRGLPVVLMNPSVPLETGRVFALRSALSSGFDEAYGEQQRSTWTLDRLAEAHNALSDAAMQLCPPLAALVEVAADVGGSIGRPAVLRLSGSGPTVFALFEEAATADEFAAEMAIRARSACRAWWVRRTSVMRSRRGDAEFR